MKIITAKHGQQVIVDDDFFEFIKDKIITIDNYPYYCNLGRRVYLHRFILNLLKGSGICADHINGNRLDCRKENLRIATYSQNNSNRAKRLNSSSKYKGVHWHKPSEKWHVNIKKNKVKIHIGSFAHEINAAISYNTAALKHHGEFAVLNMI